MTLPSDEEHEANLHVVQIGTDSSVFTDASSSGTLARQLSYLTELQGLSSNAALTYVVSAETRPQIAYGELRILGVGAPVFRLWAALRTLHQERPISVITTQDPFVTAWIALVAGARWHVPVVIQIHFEPFDHVATANSSFRRLLRSVRLRLALLAARRAAAIRVVNFTTKDRLHAVLPGHRIEVIPVPVLLAPGTASTGSEPVVLFVGRFAPEKRLDRWVAVAARVGSRVREARFVLVGTGPELESTKKAAEPLAGRFDFPGHLTGGRLRQHYEDAAVLLLTSDYEGLGRVIIEAARFGLPAVAPRIAGITDVVLDGVTGYLHDRDDIDGMASSVEALVLDHAKRRTMGAAAMQLVERRFDADDLTTRWTQLLHDVALSYRRDPSA